MAIAYASIATTAYTNSLPLVISKPSGLAVGDLMLSFINANSGSLTQPSGWTLLVDNSTTTRTGVAWKIATSGDVAASNFSWDCGASTWAGGSILRITGGSSAIQITSSTNDTATGTHTWEQPITPNFANSMIFMFVAAPFSVNASSYAIATDNPTWTEVVDHFKSSPDLMMAVAYANRPEITSTGNFSASISAGATDVVGMMVVVAPQIDVSLSPAVIDIVSAVQTPTVSGGASVSPSVIDATLSVQAPTVTLEAPMWNNTSKNTTTWTNIDKS